MFFFHFLFPFYFSESEYETIIDDVLAVEFGADGKTLFYTQPDTRHRSATVRIRNLTRTNNNTRSNNLNNDNDNNNNRDVSNNINNQSPNTDNISSNNKNNDANSHISISFSSFSSSSSSSSSSSPNSDPILYHEPDERFFVDLKLTKDRRFLTINCNSKRSSEVRVLDARNFSQKFFSENSTKKEFSERNFSGNFPLKPFWPRRDGVEYFINHGTVRERRREEENGIERKEKRREIHGRRKIMKIQRKKKRKQRMTKKQR